MNLKWIYCYHPHHEDPQHEKEWIRPGLSSPGCKFTPGIVSKRWRPCFQAALCCRRQRCHLNWDTSCVSYGCVLRFSMKEVSLPSLWGIYERCEDQYYQMYCARVEVVLICRMLPACSRLWAPSSPPHVNECLGNSWIFSVSFLAFSFFIKKKKQCGWLLCTFCF